jgi:hypothetical protein
MQNTTTYKTPSKLTIFNYSLMGFLVGFPGLVLAYNMLG